MIVYIFPCIATKRKFHEIKTDMTQIYALLYILFHFRKVYTKMQNRKIKHLSLNTLFTQENVLKQSNLITDSMYLEFVSRKCLLNFIIQ